SLWCLRKEAKPTQPREKRDAVIRGSFWCGALTALALLTIPGGLPRYLLPVYVPVSLALVGLYFQVDERWRRGYELFVYYSLLTIAAILSLTLLGGFIYSIREDLQPLWGMVIFSVLLLGAYLVWLIRVKTKPGVFISTPIAIAIAYVFISSVTIPLERERYQFRSGAEDIEELASEVDGQRVFFADKKLRNVHPKHLRLIYYLSDDFESQGETKDLPDNTRFLVGRTGSSRAMKKLIGNRSIEQTVDLEIDGLPFTAYYLAKETG
ncbi:MAG: hypothetical protein AAGF67_06855, partial [Verrucomicrobiota bacterium]